MSAKLCLKGPGRAPITEGSSAHPLDTHKWGDSGITSLLELAFDFITVTGIKPSTVTNATPVTPPDIVELDSVHIEENGADKEAISPSGLAPSITRVRRPSYSRLAAPPAVRPSARPRTRRPTHVVDLAYGRARIDASVPDASVPAQSLSVPSQRHNALPTEA